MKHEYENLIKCPYCDWEDSNSWEFGEDNGVSTCGCCEKEFNVTREVSVTYSTSRKYCEEGKHNYKLESCFERKRNFKNEIWHDLPEAEWTYYKIKVCCECERKNYIKITKEEYELLK